MARLEQPVLFWYYYLEVVSRATGELIWTGRSPNFLDPGDLEAEFWISDMEDRYPDDMLEELWMSEPFIGFEWWGFNRGQGLPFSMIGGP